MGGRRKEGEEGLNEGQEAQARVPTPPLPAGPLWENYSNVSAPGFLISPSLDFI